MKQGERRRGKFSSPGRWLLLVICITVLGVIGIFGRGAPAAFAAAPTTLTVSSVSGTYGGTAGVTANLSSAGTPIAGESVDLHIGATDLGPVITDVNGDATIPAASLVGINAGTYTNDVTASFAGDVNFDPANGSNDLVVTPAPLTITADNQTKVYGAALPTLTASYSGFVNGDTAASLTTAPTISTTATAASHVAGSPYAITASGAVDSNYTISYGPGSLSVTSAPLTITADDQTNVYGAPLPTLTASYSGLVNGDTAASLTTAPTITTSATPTSPVAGSPYAISASGAVDSDYLISYVDGSLTVTPAPLTITADDQSKVYGDALPTLTASITGFQNGENLATSDVVGSPSLSTTATAASHVAGNPYTITATQGSLNSSDYSFSFVSGSLTITSAPLTITADDQTKVYGAALPTLTASYTGFVNGDTAASLTTAPTLTTTATAASHVAGSPYAITASGAVDSDYSISYVPGSLTITSSPLTITADDQIKTYGAALPTLTASYTGFVNGDTAASLTIAPTITTSATAASHVAGSPYAITASGAVDPDYTISYVAGSLTITAAPLTITADDQTKVYGATLPTLTASFTGFVNGDTAASLTAMPTVTTTATAASHVAGSPYAITASGALDSDYTISYVPGNLTITVAPLTITADNQTKAFGAALPTLTASYTGFVNGDTAASLTTAPTITTTATAGSTPGGYPITASGAADADYTISYVAGTLTIGVPPVTNPPAPSKITPVISWATPAAITFGAALSAVQLNASASVPGTFTYSSPAGTVLGLGANLVTVLFVPFDTVDYNDASALVYITVQAAPPATATAIPVVATSTPTPVPTTAPVVVSPATATAATSTATPTVPVTLVVHNNARTEIGGRAQACALAKNTNGAKQRGCEIVSSVSAPGATVTYTLTYQDGSVQNFTDIADSRGHSLHAFNVAYRPAAGTGGQAVRSVAHITVLAMLPGGATLSPVHVRFAVIR